MSGRPKAGVLATAADWMGNDTVVKALEEYGMVGGRSPKTQGLTRSQSGCEVFYTTAMRPRSETPADALGCRQQVLALAVHCQCNGTWTIDKSPCSIKNGHRTPVHGCARLWAELTG